MSGPTKVHIKLGDMEVNYEGDAEFVKSGLLDLITSVHQVHAKNSPIGSGNEDKKVSDKKDSAGRPLQMTTNSIAMKLTAKSGSEVATAAIAYLSLVKGQDSFKRDEILDEMKKAVGIYKPSMSGNLSSALTVLMKGDVVVESAANTYSLTPAAKAKLEQQIGA